MDRSLIRERARLVVTSLAVVCIAFVLSQLFYMAIAWFLLVGPTGLEGMAPALPAVVSWTLAAVGAGLVIMAPALQAVLLRQVREQAGSLDELVRRYRGAVVVGYAVREGPGIVGLVLALLTGDLRWSLGLGLLASLALLSAWPRIGSVEEWLAAAALRLDDGTGTGPEPSP